MAPSNGPARRWETVGGVVGFIFGSVTEVGLFSLTDGAFAPEGGFFFVGVLRPAGSAFLVAVGVCVDLGVRVIVLVSLATSY